MGTFVLIHGAWLGRWCWYKLTPSIEQAGHRVVTFDLPAHGEDSSPVLSASLQSYIDRAAQMLDQQAEPVIVVSPTAQKQMYTATSCQQILSLETGHASFFAAPEKLAAHLLSLSM